MIKYFIIITILFSSCDIFSTREPEEPNDNASLLLSQNSEDNLLSNFISALKGLNSVNYLNTLADNSNSEDNFTFSPTGVINQNYTELFNFWSKNDENNFIITLNSKLTEKKMNIILQNQDWSYQIDSTVLTADYKISLVHNYNIPKYYEGKLQLVMIKNDNNIWYIKRWLDYIKNDSLDDISFSDLKVNFK